MLGLSFESDLAPMKTKTYSAFRVDVWVTVPAAPVRLPVLACPV
jgi:hypothetical protein